jgi:hypothetical protein
MWRWGLRFLVVVVFVCVAFGGMAAVVWGLPVGRHFELVSPSYKGGYGVLDLLATGMGGAGEGEGVVFDSTGHFAGSPVGASTGSYLARRGASEWSTTPLLPPQAVATSSVLNDISPLLKGLYTGSPGSNALAGEEEGEHTFMFHDLLAADSEAAFSTPFSEVPFGVPLERLDKQSWPLLGSTTSDPGFCDVVFRGNGEGFFEGPRAFLEEAMNAREQIYDLVTGAPGCGGERALHLVAVGNTLGSHHEPALLEPSCVSSPGQGINAVAAGGSEIFFASCPTSATAQLYMRLESARTVHISTPLAADCVSGPCIGSHEQLGQFVGANEAGTRAFFTTNQPLVTGDTDMTSDLYMAEIGCPEVEADCEAAKREVTSLVQVSHAPSVGEAAEVQGVTALSPDGQRVYFVAHGVLSGANAEGAVPAKGAENLYVYDRGEGVGTEEATTRFIADLCSGPQLSGVVMDHGCPSDLEVGGRNDDGLWSSNSKEAQTTGDGSFLVFTTYGRLLASDTDTGRDVYRYDAQSETLDRVSVGEEGYSQNGNAEGYDVRLPLRQVGQVQVNDELGYRAISEDGSRIVFETNEPLSPDDSNGLTNAYEWHKEPGWSEGKVALVSTGSDEYPVGEELGGSHLVKEVMITPSGRDIFFLTTQGLVSQDTDGAEDVYDARLGEGFPSAPESTKECEGDACQDSLTNPAPLLVPGSAVQAPGENLAPPAAEPKKKASPKCAKGKKLSHGKCVKAKATKKKTKAKKSGRRGK